MAVTTPYSIWQPETFGQHLLDLSVGDLLSARNVDCPRTPAIIYNYPELGITHRWTYADLKAHVDNASRALMALGVGHADKVAVLATNVPEWIVLELAIGQIGAVLVTVNTNSRESELRYLLGQGDVHTLFTQRAWRDNRYLETLQQLVPETHGNADDPLAPIASAAFPCLRHIVAIDTTPAPGIPTMEEVLRQGHAITPAALQARKNAVHPHDVFQIQFTSGTTGNPKGATITHYAAINNARLFAQRAGFRAGDLLVSAMPMFHTAGNAMELLGVLSHGATLVKAISYDATKLLQLIHDERATVLSAVPTMVIGMLQCHAEHPGRFDTASLRAVISGGTPIPVPVMEQVATLFGAQPVIGFGMTETSPMVTCTLASDSFEHKSATVGIPLPFVEVKIVDADEQPVPLGASGQLLVRGFLVTQGYYKAADKTAQAIDPDGWLRSGDLASMDANGYLRIVGRIKDMVIRGGENVYPAEVETFLMQHPAIRQAQVIGVPDAYMGEETAAFVQCHENQSLAEDELIAYCKARIARHKVPRYIRFVHEFPLTPSGKVKKFELRAQFDNQAEQ